MKFQKCSKKDSLRQFIKSKETLHLTRIHTDVLNNITITSILGKIVEKVHLMMVHNVLDEAQNKLQRGFTKDTSSTCGSLLRTDRYEGAIHK